MRIESTDNQIPAQRSGDQASFDSAARNARAKQTAAKVSASEDQNEAKSKTGGNASKPLDNYDAPAFGAGLSAPAVTGGLWGDDGEFRVNGDRALAPRVSASTLRQSLEVAGEMVRGVGIREIKADMPSVGGKAIEGALELLGVSDRQIRIRASNADIANYATTDYGSAELPASSESSGLTKSEARTNLLIAMRIRLAVSTGGDSRLGSGAIGSYENALDAAVEKIAQDTPGKTSSQIARQIGLSQDIRRGNADDNFFASNFGLNEVRGDSPINIRNATVDEAPERSNPGKPNTLATVEYFGTGHPEVTVQMKNANGKWQTVSSKPADAPGDNTTGAQVTQKIVTGDAGSVQPTDIRVLDGSGNVISNSDYITNNSDSQSNDGSAPSSTDFTVPLARRNSGWVPFTESSQRAGDVVVALAPTRQPAPTDSANEAESPLKPSRYTGELPPGVPFTHTQFETAHEAGVKRYGKLLKQSSDPDIQKYYDLQKAAALARSGDYNNADLARIQSDLTEVYQKNSEKIGKLRHQAHLDAGSESLGMSPKNVAREVKDWLLSTSTVEFIAGLEQEQRSAFVDEYTMKAASYDVDIARDTRAELTQKLAQNWGENWTQNVSEEQGADATAEAIGDIAALRFAAVGTSVIGSSLQVVARRFENFDEAQRDRIGRTVYNWLNRQQANPEFEPGAADIPGDASKAERTLLGKIVDSKVLKTIGGLGAATAFGLRFGSGDTDNAWGRASAAADAMQIVGASDGYLETLKYLGSGVLSATRQLGLLDKKPAASGAAAGEPSRAERIVQFIEDEGIELDTIEGSAFVGTVSEAAGISESDATAFYSAMDTFRELDGESFDSADFMSAITAPSDVGSNDALNDLLSQDTGNVLDQPQVALNNDDMQRFLADQEGADETGANSAAGLFDDIQQPAEPEPAPPEISEGGSGGESAGSASTAATGEDVVEASGRGLKAAKVFSSGLGMLSGAADLIYAARTFKSASDEFQDGNDIKGGLDVGLGSSLGIIGGGGTLEAGVGLADGAGFAVGQGFADAASTVPFVDAIAIPVAFGFLVADLAYESGSPGRASGKPRRQQNEAFLSGDNALNRDYTHEWGRYWSA